MNLKTALKNAPLVGPLISRLRAPTYVDSLASYWEDRYATGGHSGAGSYGRLAEFKAEFINGFVERNNIQSVIEFGVGDGAQLALANYPRFIGVDVSQTSIDMCRQKFGDSPTHLFYTSKEAAHEELTAELSLSLDVVYHLVDDAIFESYMQRLFDAAGRSVIIYASDEDRPEAPHVRHRKFSRWVEKKRPEFKLRERVPNRYPYDSADTGNTSFADFFVYDR
jgi:hypothetical protein